MYAFRLLVQAGIPAIVMFIAMSRAFEDIWLVILVGLPIATVLPLWIVNRRWFASWASMVEAADLDPVHHGPASDKLIARLEGLGFEMTDRFANGEPAADTATLVLDDEGITAIVGGCGPEAAVAFGTELQGERELSSISTQFVYPELEAGQLCQVLQSADAEQLLAAHRDALAFLAEEGIAPTDTSTQVSRHTYTRDVRKLRARVRSLRFWTLTLSIAPLLAKLRHHARPLRQQFPEGLSGPMAKDTPVPPTARRQRWIVGALTVFLAVLFGGLIVLSLRLDLALGRLRDGSSQERLAAMDALWSLPISRTGFDLLYEIAEQPDPWLQVSALDLLQAVSIDDPRTLDLLRQALGQDGSEAASLALEVLAERGSGEAAAVIGALDGATDPWTTEEIVEAIVVMHQVSSGPTSIAARLVRTAKHSSSPHGRIGALDALSRITTSTDERYVAALHGAMTSAAPRVRARAATDLARVVDPSGATIQSLARALGDPDWRVASLAGSALEKFGMTAVPTLEQNAKAPEPSVRVEARAALVQLGPRSDSGWMIPIEELRALIKAIDDGAIALTTEEHFDDVEYNERRWISANGWEIRRAPAPSWRLTRVVAPDGRLTTTADLKRRAPDLAEARPSEAIAWLRYGIDRVAEERDGTHCGRVYAAAAQPPPPAPIERFSIETIADLALPTGRLIVDQPYLPEGPPLDAAIPPGSYPVQLVLAHYPDDRRVACAIVRIDTSPIVRWQMAVPVGSRLEDLGADKMFGYPVDGGTAGFIDASAAEVMQRRFAADPGLWDRSSDEQTAAFEVSDWLHAITIADPKSGANLVAFSTGFGDGYYASYLGFDRHGEIAAVLTDFEIIPPH